MGMLSSGQLVELASDLGAKILDAQVRRGAVEPAAETAIGAVHRIPIGRPEDLARHLLGAGAIVQEANQDGDDATVKSGEGFVVGVVVVGTPGPLEELAGIAHRVTQTFGSVRAQREPPHSSCHGCSTPATVGM